MIQLDELTNLIHRILQKTGIELIGVKTRPVWDGEEDRFPYQRKFFSFDIVPDEKVLDVGSGGDPFPHATVLLDLNRERSNHRAAELKTNGKPFLVASINRLPFENKSWDFVYCCHVLEHVDDPVSACAELIRVGKRGYIETPSLMTDVLFSWAKGMHKWFTITIGGRLVFFEYGPRLLEGVKDSYWSRAVFSKRYHPIQKIFYSNLDIFNNGFMWRDHFECIVFRQDGSIERNGV